ncbi:MAG: 2-polyprenyl-3-methyl-5-hydroxy-6-metoxy-1,4-benzoquinol methylase [Nonlabens sp.]|jgi:2-polyprenyl-3-methyl-5-hydroxy-6-metoxy-1,4-benzoquinol methylase
MNVKNIIDIGCGSGFKLIKYFSRYDIKGLDIEPTLSYLRKKYPHNKWLNAIKTDMSLLESQMVICSDVIEHVLDPKELLIKIKSVNKFQKLVISATVRDLVYSGSQNGPPKKPTYIREWSYSEFNEFISSYFKIEKHFISNREQRTQTIICSPL